MEGSSMDKRTQKKLERLERVKKLEMMEEGKRLEKMVEDYGNGIRVAVMGAWLGGLWRDYSTNGPYNMMRSLDLTKYKCAIDPTAQDLDCWGHPRKIVHLFTEVGHVMDYTIDADGNIYDEYEEIVFQLRLPSFKITGGG